MKAFKRWQDSQKSEAEKVAKTERVKSQATENKFLAVSKSIPANLAETYVKLAETYQSEETDLAAALDLALKDFPIKTIVPNAILPANPDSEQNDDEFTKRLAKYRRE